jgi:hypothetical protein
MKLNLSAVKIKGNVLNTELSNKRQSKKTGGQSPKHKKNIKPTAKTAEAPKKPEATKPAEAPKKPDTPASKPSTSPSDSGTTTKKNSQTLFNKSDWDKADEDQRKQYVAEYDKLLSEDNAERKKQGLDDYEEYTYVKEWKDKNNGSGDSTDNKGENEDSDSDVTSEDELEQIKNDLFKMTRSELFKKYGLEDNEDNRNLYVEMKKQNDPKKKGPDSQDNVTNEIAKRDTGPISKDVVTTALTKIGATELYELVKKGVTTVEVNGRTVVSKAAKILGESIYAKLALYSAAFIILGPFALVIAHEGVQLVADIDDKLKDLDEKNKQKREETNLTAQGKYLESHLPKNLTYAQRMEIKRDFCVLPKDEYLDKYRFVFHYPILEKHLKGKVSEDRKHEIIQNLKKINDGAANDCQKLKSLVPSGYTEDEYNKFIEDFNTIGNEDEKFEREDFLKKYPFVDKDRFDDLRFTNVDKNAISQKQYLSKYPEVEADTLDKMDEEIDKLFFDYKDYDEQIRTLTSAVPDKNGMYEVPLYGDVVFKGNQDELKEQLKVLKDRSEGQDYEYDEEDFSYKGKGSKKKRKFEKLGHTEDQVDIDLTTMDTVKIKKKYPMLNDKDISELQPDEYIKKRLRKAKENGSKSGEYEVEIGKKKFGPYDDYEELEDKVYDSRETIIQALKKKIEKNTHIIPSSGSNGGKKNEVTSSVLFIAQSAAEIRNILNENTLKVLPHHVQQKLKEVHKEAPDPKPEELEEEDKQEKQSGEVKQVSVPELDRKDEDTKVNNDLEVKESEVEAEVEDEPEETGKIDFDAVTKVTKDLKDDKVPTVKEADEDIDEENKIDFDEVEKTTKDLKDDKVPADTKKEDQTEEDKGEDKSEGVNSDEDADAPEEKSEDDDKNKEEYITAVVEELVSYYLKQDPVKLASYFEKKYPKLAAKAKKKVESANSNLDLIDI